MSTKDNINQISFAELLKDFKKTLKGVFYERYNLQEFVQQRGFPPIVLRDIMALNPFSVGIPTEYGGRGAKVKECMGLMSAASYESLPLSLTFGINLALFLEPTAKYAQDSVKKEVFQRFLTKQHMGGLMITEPDFGSDALNMQTSNVKVGNNYHIKGTKHWQGLTGMADYWLMTSRNRNEQGELGRDLDFFVVDTHAPNQHIEVEEYYNNIGLYPIPYGKNNIDIQVPQQYKLIPESTGLKLMMDLLHRSRFQFSGMGMGFIHRMLDETIKQTNERIVGGKSLFSLDQVKHQISRIQSAFTVSSAMCHKASLLSSIENNLADLGVEANSLKAYITDLMQESAQTLTQLCGANGYKTENVGSRGIVDSRPFQIFEGSNEMLYTQISEMVLKLMGRKKISQLSEFISIYAPTKNIASYFKGLLDFKIDAGMAQRKLVDLGKIISRIVSANDVINMGDKGFRADLIDNCLETIKHEVTTLTASLHFKTAVVPITNYSEKSSWLDLS